VSARAGAPVTLAAAALHQIEVKHSRFFAHAEPVQSPAAALAMIQRQAQPAATHNCWAYRIGPLYRFNDDGEPAGTAGRPILSAIDAQGIDQVVVLVIRYFGGVKLGAGGLARAYGGCAAECLRQAYKIPIFHLVMITISCTFAHASRVHELLARHGASKAGETFESAGARIRASLPADALAALEHDLAALSRGTITLRIDEDR
jgi:uncharacterized YigZ family protein